jgi:hypothetical protein
VCRKGLSKELDAMLALDPVVHASETEKLVLAEAVGGLRDLLGYLDESQWKYDTWKQ